MGCIALDGLDQVRDQVATPLELHLDLRPRVVDEVAHQHRQQRGVAAHLAGRRGVHLDRLSLAQGLARRLRDHAPRERAQLDFGGLGGGAALQPRQRQQLLDQPAGAVAAFQRGLPSMAAAR